MKGEFVNTRYAKGEGEGASKYEKSLLCFEERGECPFCPKNLQLLIKKKIGKWSIAERSWPCKNAELYFLIVGEEHKTNFSELTVDDLGSIKSLVDWATEEFGISGGGFAFRFGDTDRSGATISHLHIHLIVPKLDMEGYSKVVDFSVG